MTAFPFDGVFGLLSDADKADLHRLSSLAGAVNGEYVEVGSYQGLSSLCIVSGMPKGRSLLCFDFFEPDKLPVFKKNAADAGYSNRIMIHVGNFKETMGAKLPPSIAFAFIDHDHTLESTKASYDAIWPRLSIGGIIAHHDYRHPDYMEPTQFIDAIVGTRLDTHGGIIAIQKTT